jgi:putative DNA-invertase from lambdoid prophage Rac
MTKVFYATLSPAEPPIDLQRAEAEQQGFAIDQIVADPTGIGLRLRERKGGARLFELLRTGDILVVRWVDRLGRNYEDVFRTIREFMRRGIVIKTVINGFTFDGTTQDPIQTAVQEAVLGFIAATAEAQAEAATLAQRAGIDYAKQNKKLAYLGRKPTFSRDTFEAVRNMLAQSVGIAQIAKNTGLSRQAIYRIKDDPAGCQAALEKWAMRGQADLSPIAARLAELAKGRG